MARIREATVLRTLMALGVLNVVNLSQLCLMQRAPLFEQDGPGGARIHTHKPKASHYLNRLTDKLIHLNIPKLDGMCEKIEKYGSMRPI